MLLAIASVRMFSHSLAVHEGRISYLPENVLTLTSFNDFRMFQQDKDNPRRFVFSDKYDGGFESYLRFVIPNFDPSPYKLVLRLRARPELLWKSKVRSARETLDGVSVLGDIATYDISMKDSSSFVWTDNRCYVGVMFPNQH